VEVAHVVAVSSAGTVIAPFRVGPTLLARVPLVPVTGPEAAARVEAEGRYAQVLSGRLPIQVPRLVGVGGPFDGYDGVWSLWTWLDGRSLDLVLDEDLAASDLDALAVDLARVLRAHRSLPTGGAAWSGTGRGGRPLMDTEWVRTSIRRSAHLIDPVAATRVWERALTAPAHQGPPVSINGDAMPGNFLLTDGRLSGMIDVAEPVVGDPASDLQPAWVVFKEPQRTAFRTAMGLAESAWQRGRGWAFEMAIGGLHYYERTNPIFFRMARRTLQRLIATS
jgi:aminoglycoside phosphotransferase (APT) family kinase protein